MTNYQTLAVINLGGHSAYITAQAVRSLGVFSVIIPAENAEEYISNNSPLGIIVTGDCADIIAEKQEKLGWLNAINIPVLEVGLGTAVSTSSLQGGMGQHGLNAFLKSSCGFSCNWSVDDYISDLTADLKDKIGNRKAVITLPGSVESTVAAALLASMLKEQLICIYICNGLGHKNYDDAAVDYFQSLNTTFCRINAESTYLYKLLGVADPSKKRKIVEEEYITTLSNEVSKNSERGVYLAKGTSYSENCDEQTFTNVDFKYGDCTFIGITEPLKLLTKEEVINLGKSLGIPEIVLYHQPLPFTGMATRCLGVITKEKLDILQESDTIVCEEIEKIKNNTGITQYFAVVSDTKATGIRNGKVNYEYTVFIRVVESQNDGSQIFANISSSTLRDISRRITTEVNGVSRVLFDITDKPPATIEFE